MKRANQTRAFTLVELLVVIGIIAILIAILLPSLTRARQQAMTVACLSNLRQIGIGLTAYTIENKGYLPHGNANYGINSWTARLAPWTLSFPNTQYNSLKPYKVYSCRAIKPITSTTYDLVPNGYKANAYLGLVGGGDAADLLHPYKLSMFKTPAKKVFCLDAIDKQNLIRFIAFSAFQTDPANGIVDMRHPNKTCNVLFLDGHAATLDAGLIPKLRDDPTAKKWMMYDTAAPDGL